MSNKTPWKKIVSDPNFLGEADFAEGEEKIATISHVVGGVSIKSAEGTSEKSVVYFKEQIKPMILNVARAKAITKVAGSRFVEDWCGVQIQLYIEDGIKAFGDIVSAVRVRPRRPVIRQAVKCSACGRDIQAAMGKGVDYIITHSTKKFGTPLCFECATKRSEATKKEQQPASEGVTNNAAETDS